MRISAAVLHANRGPLCVEEVELGDPRPDEVLVQVEAVGICRSDVEFSHFFPTPVVLGHEGSGRVVGLGASVDDLEVGAPVVLTSQSCGYCRRCQAGAPTYCDHFDALNFAGSRPDGTSVLSGPDGLIRAHFLGQSSFATHVVVPRRSVIPVPVEAVGQLAALGPFGCGFQTGAGAVLECLHCAPGSSLAVFGTGAVGLAAVATAALVGCGPIVAVDVSEPRLHHARALGATLALNPAEGDSAGRILAAVPEGIDASIDTTGRAEVLADAVAVLNTRGTCAMVGVGPSDELTLDWRTMLNGRTVTGVIGGGGVPQLLVPRLLRWFAAGRLPLDRCIEYFDFANIDRAFGAAASGEVVKAVVRMAP